MFFLGSHEKTRGKKSSFASIFTVITASVDVMELNKCFRI